MIPDIDQNNINNFKELLKKWIKCYVWREISYLAFKTTEGPFLLFSRILFDTSKTASPFKFESDHILAGRDVVQVSAEEIWKIIENAITGKLSIAGDSILLIPDDHGRYSLYFDPFYHLQFGPRFPCLQMRGKQKHQLLSQIGNDTFLDWEIQAADTPFYNLDELLATIGLPSLLQMGDSTRLELIVRWPGMITHRSIIEKGHGRIQCQVASGIDVKGIKLGYKILLPTSTERGHLLGDAIKWEKDGDFQVGKVNIEVGDAPLMQVFLSYEGEALHQWWVTDPQKHLNLRNAVHEVFDNKAEVLRQFLIDPKDSGNFELGFSMLLNLLGFSTSHYGHIPKIQKGPDIIAITPGENIGIIECTIGLLDEKDKLAKLVQRTKLIKDKLEASGYGYIMIQPVIVTALSREEITADVEKANKYKIVIVCREDIEVLLRGGRVCLDNLKQFLSDKLPCFMPLPASEVV